MLGGTATEAGQALTPLFLGWVVMSIVGARMTVKMGYRVAAIGGNALMTIGFVGMSALDADTPRWLLIGSCTVLGAGMGTQMLSLLLAVQHAGSPSWKRMVTSKPGEIFSTEITGLSSPSATSTNPRSSTRW